MVDVAPDDHTEQDFSLPDQNREVTERAERLRAAVKSAGGNAKVAGKIGMPLTTLSRYLGGRDMKAAALVALADACNVSFDWLGTGRGPMRAGDQPIPEPSAPPPPPPAAPFRLFGSVKIDQLVSAYEGALASSGGRDRRLLMHLTIVLYDSLSEAREVQENQGIPQLSPQKAPQE